MNLICWSYQEIKTSYTFSTPISLNNSLYGTCFSSSVDPYPTLKLHTHLLHEFKHSWNSLWVHRLLFEQLSIMCYREQLFFFSKPEGLNPPKLLVKECIADVSSQNFWDQFFWEHLYTTASNVLITVRLIQKNPPE